MIIHDTAAMLRDIVRLKEDCLPVPSVTMIEVCKAAALEIERHRDLAGELRKYFATDPPAGLSCVSDLYLLLCEVEKHCAVTVSAQRNEGA